MRLRGLVKLHVEHRRLCKLSEVFQDDVPVVLKGAEFVSFLGRHQLRVDTHCFVPVSYLHLTLPTIHSLWFSVVSGAFK